MVPTPGVCGVQVGSLVETAATARTGVREHHVRSHWLCLHGREQHWRVASKDTQVPVAVLAAQGVTEHSPLDTAQTVHRLGWLTVLLRILRVQVNILKKALEETGF